MSPIYPDIFCRGELLRATIKYTTCDLEVLSEG